ncbi:MAG: hypothetical protein K2J82_10105 [Muribaculaceae bacterium]|nr:hypothetical protein [Muribaculaceae bacterium]MDE6754947.1 hypothetical protein [Muribaculaceae bacterium]
MAQPLLDTLSSIKDKIVRLTEIQTALRSRISQLEEENENLKGELEETRRELEKTKLDAEFLTMSHRLAESPDSLISTRRRIARLIRTIDNCISMLKEE